MLSPRSPKACWFCRRTTRGTVGGALVYRVRLFGPWRGKSGWMKAPVGTGGLKRFSWGRRGGLGLPGGPAFSPRHDAIGVRAQSSVYFAPDQWRETDSPAIGSG